jgi:hypothetical protein
MIKQLGQVEIPQDVLEEALKVQTENIVNRWPATYRKHKGNNLELIKTLSLMLSCTEEEVDYVYFSSRSGAETHTDKLPLNKFGLDTIIIPLVIPYGNNWLTVDSDSIAVSKETAYLFNHQTPHSFEVAKETGCVLIMAARRQL